MPRAQFINAPIWSAFTLYTPNADQSTSHNHNHFHTQVVPQYDQSDLPGPEDSLLYNSPPLPQTPHLANTLTAANWTDAKSRVLRSYRDWLRAVRPYPHLQILREGHKRLIQRKRQAPEIQNMYSLNLPVSTLRTKMRQEFERHRYVAQLNTTDVLLFNSHQEFQVRNQNPIPQSSSVEDIRQRANV
jgi:hypothetical protein